MGENFTQYVTECLRRTINYWRDWMGRCTYKGRWLEVVNRLIRDASFTVYSLIRLSYTNGRL
jgi:hypothetical protein